MSYGIRITGVRELQRTLGVDLTVPLKAATLAIIEEVKHEIAPYPPATAANSPSNPKGRWYERGYGPRWRVKDGAIHGRATSQTLGRRWGVASIGTIGHLLGNVATYAKWVHGSDTQARFHASRGWVTEKQAIERVIAKGLVHRHVMDAIMAAMRRR